MAIPNIMTSEYVDTELMMKGPINETTGQRMGPEWIGEIKSIGLFQSNQSKMLIYFKMLHDGSTPLLC